MSNDSPLFLPEDFCRVDLNARDPDAARLFYMRLVRLDRGFRRVCRRRRANECFFPDRLLVAEMG